MHLRRNEKARLSSFLEHFRNAAWSLRAQSIIFCCAQVAQVKGDHRIFLQTTLVTTAELIDTKYSERVNRNIFFGASTLFNKGTYSRFSDSDFCGDQRREQMFCFILSIIQILSRALCRL